MSAQLWYSIGLGGGLGLLYNLASLVTHRLALKYGERRFMAIFVGGMLARLTAVLALIALIIVFLPVQNVAFLGAFFAVFFVGLAIEVMRLHHR